MFSTYNEEKYVVSERCIRKLKNEIYKYMAAVSKNVYVDKYNIIRTMSLLKRNL